MEDNRITKKELGEAFIIGLLLIALCVMAFQLRNTQTRLTELERGTSQQASSQQAQIDSLSLYIEGVKDEMQSGFEDQQAQLDSQADQIEKQKQVSSATNKAFTRYQRKAEQTETELREELKKD